MYFPWEESPHPPATMSKKERILYIQLGFLKYDDRAASHFLNRVMRTFTNCTFFHVEIFFMLTNETCTVDADNPVRIVQNKNYKDRTWTWLKIPVSDAQYNKAYEFCKSQLECEFEPHLFCTQMFYASGASPSYREEWTCSRLAATMLVKAGIIADPVRLDFLTPDNLHSVLMDLAAKYAIRRADQFPCHYI